MSKFKILLGLVHRLLELESGLSAAIAAGAETNAKLIASERALKDSNARAHELANKPGDVSRTTQEASAVHCLRSLGYAWVEPTGWAHLKIGAKNQDESLVCLAQEPDGLITCNRCGMTDHRSSHCTTHDARGKPFGAK